MPIRDQPNPYAPPRDEEPELTRGRGGGYYRQGDLLVVEKGAELPDICIFSGQATDGRRNHRKLQWAPPWLAILVLLSPLIYIIVYYVVRETGEMGYALSADARKRRTSGIVIALGGTLAGFALFFVAATSGEPLAMVIGLIVFFVALVVGMMRVAPFKIAKIDKSHIHLKLQRAALDALKP